MDIDNSDGLDSNLLQAFSCLGTTDKDVLVSQFQKLLGNQINKSTCTFFLDMNNWNLQEAVCAYFEMECPHERDQLPSMSLVQDVTIGEGESIPPNTRFIKTWRVHNGGNESWPHGCYLKFTHGDKMNAREPVELVPVPPKENLDISVELVSPEKPGIYQGQWRVCTSAGFFFGDIIWVIITVQEGGLLGVTQQMSRLNNLGSTRFVSNLPPNPFGTMPVQRFAEEIDSTDYDISDEVIPMAPQETVEMVRLQQSDEMPPQNPDSNGEKRPDDFMMS